MQQIDSSSKPNAVRIDRIVLRMARTKRVSDDDLRTLIRYIRHLRQLEDMR